MGVRKAYEILVIQQRQRNDRSCKVTLYSLLTSYSISTASMNNRAKLHSPPLLDVNDKGIIQLTKETKKFIVGNYVYPRKDNQIKSSNWFVVLILQDAAMHIKLNCIVPVIRVHDGGKRI
jgi:hypothetical protein